MERSKIAALHGRGPGMWVSRGAMAINVHGARSSEHAYIATKWRFVMYLAMKCAKNVLLR